MSLFLTDIDQEKKIFSDFSGQRLKRKEKGSM
jgi:hypothetical protein